MFVLCTKDGRRFVALATERARPSVAGPSGTLECGRQNKAPFTCLYRLALVAHPDERATRGGRLQQREHWRDVERGGVKEKAPEHSLENRQEQASRRS